ncbi:MAG: hypothetical protein INR71_06720, partial [Terriglobus roseus]|nr:hypothetical protein [Terriglobus roseus]
MMRALACPARLRSPKTILLSLCLVLLFVWTQRPFTRLRERRYDVWREEPFVTPLSESVRTGQTPILSKTRCTGFPPDIWERVQIVVKVGAPEVRTKLATQLATNTACVEDLLVFSDYDEEYGSVKIHDALANLPRSYWHNNSDYDIYLANRAANDAGRPLGRSADGWKLDKYKFMPMMDLTYELRPGKEWYVFVEADTYVFWDNLFRFLSHHDATKALYMGSPIWRVAPPEPAFAHG